MSGPDLPVGERATNNIALVFHELATNAVKYGALSTELGKVAVDWDKFIAHRVGVEKPPFAQAGSVIRVRDETGAEIYEAPIETGPGYRSRHVA